MRINKLSTDKSQLAGEGSASLRVGQIVDCASFRPSPRMLFHGTPVHPDQMGKFVLARQAQHHIGEQRINHGPQPAVSTSSDLVFPAIRSLLHEGHKDVGQDFPIILNRLEDNQGRPFIFTAAELVKHLATQKSKGFVYATASPPAGAAPFDERADLAEWRIPESMRWDWVGCTTVADFPPDLLVVDAPAAETQTFLDAFIQSNTPPLELSKRLGITVMHFVDYGTR